ncbi:hypothetical protein LSH36_767g00017 [Paralvinella palmiformis]|uniref:Uncharacterized protein n=1 Tax=Paralvinella palmiformis TaxID=53620 RepID=A0AAD9MSN1_9ANNE|nr:hypothetical protein LSH36_767g00017 [Paralvinella palmiformis]
MGQLNAFQHSLVATLAILMTIWQVSEAKPRWNLASVQDSAYSPLLPDETANPPEDSLAYPDSKSYPKGAKLDTLLNILTRIRSNALQTDETSAQSPILNNILNQLKKEEGLAVADETQKRSADLHNNLQSVLPPWQEFCLMLRMGNCWRYKRSVPEPIADPSTNV